VAWLYISTGHNLLDHRNVHDNGELAFTSTAGLDDGHPAYNTVSNSIVHDNNHNTRVGEAAGGHSAARA